MDPFIAYRPRNLFCVLACFLGMMVIGTVAGAGAMRDLIVQRHDGIAVSLRLELAKDAQSRRRGLMWRENLLPRTGMLFDFERQQRVHMWMKNTRMPLDILFVAESGEIVQIEHKATPGSLRLITSRQNVRYVIEINGGEADELHFAPGDHVLLTQWREFLVP